MHRATAGGLVDVYCEEVAMFLLDKAGGLIGIPDYRSDVHGRSRSRYTGECNPGSDLLNSAPMADLTREFRAQCR
jgi:hypothetical protein